MKVQIQGQALRLRIDEAELQRLLDGDPVSNDTHWPDGQTSRQQLALGDTDVWQRFDAGWCITLAAADVRALAERLPSREGINTTLAAPNGTPIQLQFDVDVRDSARRLKQRRHEASP